MTATEKKAPLGVVASAFLMDLRARNTTVERLVKLKDDPKVSPHTRGEIERALDAYSQHTPTYNGVAQ